MAACGEPALPAPEVRSWSTAWRACSRSERRRSARSSSLSLGGAGGVHRVRLSVVAPPGAAPIPDLPARGRVRRSGGVGAAAATRSRGRRHSSCRLPVVGVVRRFDLVGCCGQVELVELTEVCFDLLLLAVVVRLGVCVSRLLDGGALGVGAVAVGLLHGALELLERRGQMRGDELLEGVSREFVVRGPAGRMGLLVGRRALKSRSGRPARRRRCFTGPCVAADAGTCGERVQSPERAKSPNISYVTWSAAVPLILGPGTPARGGGSACETLGGASPPARRPQPTGRCPSVRRTLRDAVVAAISAAPSTAPRNNSATYGSTASARFWSTSPRRSCPARGRGREPASRRPHT